MTGQVDDGARRLLTIRELGEQLRLSERTIRRMKADDVIPHVMVGGAVRFRQSDVDAYLDSLQDAE